MSEVTRPIDVTAASDRQAAADLLPLVYDDLRKLAAARMSGERPDHTLDATALVHEARLRLGGDRSFESKSHFMRAAAEAMRRILVERAWRKHSGKHGGGRNRTAAAPDQLAASQPPEPLELQAIHEALDRLAEKSPRKAELVKLRFFLGCTVAEAAELLGIAPATARQRVTLQVLGRQPMAPCQRGMVGSIWSARW